MIRVYQGLSRQRERIGDEEAYEQFVREATLKAVDDGWVELIDYLEQLKYAVAGRASAQRNVTVSYTHLDVYKRQGMYRSKYWSCFDAIAQVRRKKVAVLSYHDIKWPKGLEFVYSPFSIIALQGDVKYAQVEFGEDGNPISIDMFEEDVYKRQNVQSIARVQHRA